MVPPNAPLDADLVTLSDLVDPLRRQWKLVVGVPMVVASLILAVSLILPRTYEAKAVFAAVGPNRALGGLGSLAALAGAVPGQGLTASPEFVQALLQSRHLLNAVGAAIPPGRTQPLVEEMAGRSVPSSDIVKRMERHVRIQISRQTGLIVLQFRHKDSSLARVAETLIESELRSAFSTASRAQAGMQREAQDRRVDSAYTRLRNAEQALREFASRNRGLAPYAQSTLELEESRRAVDVAKQFYLRAVEDRDDAEARELQDAPVVVTIDPVPAEMPFAPRLIGLKVALAAFGSGLLVILGVYLNLGWRRPFHP